MFRNNQAVLPHWTKQMARYINYAGVDNVFVSILESNSDDATGQILEQFDAQLADMGVARRIITHDATPHDDRISFLSAVRNRVLEPLIEKGGYDRVLFSNDVFIEAEAIVELIKTRDGDWDFVCGLDFGPWGLYDQWVIRDRLGRTLSTNWPYFFEDAGLHAILREEPVPVFTCWNGIVAFKADPLIPVSLRTPGRLSTSPLSNPLPSSHPAYPQPLNTTPADTAPLLFRPNGKNEPCFTSESFNLPYDFRRQFDLQNIYVNARVITAYEWDFYLWHKYLLRHWAVKWFVQKIENGYNYHSTKLINGNPEKMWTWDGGDCHPWGW
ncbi:cryptococcal mannosyltransferase 1-domain-containing protein [Roridomyces roridus]|uniref:Cryptococcal mannosyltransferase 1-domain-containing protein n=1 Tax=Roridomyces roridus TaxID=1738132 RepID=A0AAD7FNT7_9AGAR|nr:cryptococcal mannosyltransferase 1-domain-containing protein [Roridomyces roridus]